jgi:hypothetical protein
MFYINHFAVHNKDVVHTTREYYKRLMRYPFRGCFLGANVAVQCLFCEHPFGV